MLKHIDYIPIKKKWINSALNCERGVCLPIIELSQQRYVWEDVGIQRKQPKPYTIAGPCITMEIFAINIRNKFDAIQEIPEALTPNDEYENIINAHIESAAECILTKLRAKKWVPWETSAVRKKRVNVKTASLCNKRNPTNTNAQKLGKA